MNNNECDIVYCGKFTLIENYIETYIGNDNNNTNIDSEKINGKEKSVEKKIISHRDKY